MEIEFKSDEGETTGGSCSCNEVGRRLRVGRGARGLQDKEESRAPMEGTAFPVLLVVRNPEGEVRWMEVGTLRGAGDGASST